ncbi:sperm-specific protein Don juan-like isoform X3 [Paramacrobiotus metropolitanus]|uniref:sperm-specific protein Don juan-like isoform X3 n=1 Tax=Paramacrobiotus metropolitanus TaxID=2943436 RepID=UPI0024464968|nr:sperm-specific protein Don juan-like isoform X3 [Paramacrobiotus metropolitanus]
MKQTDSDASGGCSVDKHHGCNSCHSMSSTSSTGSGQGSDHDHEHHSASHHKKGGSVRFSGLDNMDDDDATPGDSGRHHSFEDELNMDIEESQRHQHGGCGDENCGCQKKRKRSGCAKKKPPCPKKKKSACPKKKAKKVNECKKADPCKSKTKVDKCDKCQKPKPKCGCKPKKDKCSKSDICEHGRPAEDPCSKCHKPASDGCHKLKEDKCSKPGKPDPCGHRPKQSAKPACECQNDCCANHKEEKHCNHQ